MTTDDEVRAAIKQALADPGKVVARERDDQVESVVSWQLHAVMAVVTPLVGQRDQALAAISSHLDADPTLPLGSLVAYLIERSASMEAERDEMRAEIARLTAERAVAIRDCARLLVLQRDGVAEVLGLPADMAMEDLANAILQIRWLHAEAQWQRDQARAKLDMPCGSCHPCTNWADETWRRNGRKPPTVQVWEDVNAELEDLRARVAAAVVLPDMLAEFHASFGQSFGDGGSGDNARRARLHDEEHRELIEALEDGNEAAIAHELADVVYVAYGTAHSLGIPLDVVLAEIHRANMSKAGPDGRFRLDGNGKVVKPRGFLKADVAEVIQSWRGVATQPAEPAGEDEPCPIADCDVDVVHGHEGYGPRYAPATQPEPPDEPPGPFTDEAIRAHSRSQLEHLRAVAYMIDPSAGRVSDSKEDDRGE